MQHPLELEIRDRLHAYLSGKISLQDFEDWFFPKTWDVDTVGDTALLDLVYQMKLDWAEFTNGDWTEEELRCMLRSLAERFTIVSSSHNEIGGLADFRAGCDEAPAPFHPNPNHANSRQD